MPSITWQKTEHKHAILDLLRERVVQQPENAERIVVAVTVMAMRKMTLQELTEWHEHLENPVQEEEE